MTVIVKLFKDILEAVFPPNGIPTRATVLIVEDQDTIREFYRHVLIAQNVKVLTATNASEALRLVPDADVLLLDWRLNGDARVVLDEWQAEKTAQPCAVLTGALTVEEANHLYSNGVFNVLLKPVSVEVLISVLRHFVADVAASWQIAALRKEVKQLRRLVLVLAFVAAVTIFGTDVVSLLNALL